MILRTTFTVKGLTAAAEKTRQTLLEGRLNDARISLRNLVSRDVTSLPESLVTAATIESVAENTTDSYIAPWFAFAILGVPGAMAYRGDQYSGQHAGPSRPPRIPRQGVRSSGRRRKSCAGAPQRPIATDCRITLPAPSSPWLADHAARPKPHRQSQCRMDHERHGPTIGNTIGKGWALLPGTGNVGAGR